MKKHHFFTGILIVSLSLTAIIWGRTYLPASGATPDIPIVIEALCGTPINFPEGSDIIESDTSVRVILPLGWSYGGLDEIGLPMFTNVENATIEAIDMPDKNRTKRQETEVRCDCTQPSTETCEVLVQPGPVLTCLMGSGCTDCAMVIE